ncbi:Lrp/AsnC family transcriptional regulator [Kocuria rhizophila]|uniref:Lrp/AsnC family transcriptional regulator n=1 Tax=Kocuria rhizophila TaxID=72000 RepID=UPI003D6EF36B
MNDDAELVRVLQQDGRASVQEIARQIGRPRAAVAARLNMLLREGGVRVVAAVAPAVLGQRVLAHVSIRVDGPTGAVAAYLAVRPETVLVSAIGGSHDLVAEVRCASMDALSRFLDGVRAESHVAEVNVVQYLSVVRGFFVSRYLGGVSIDSVDIALIGMLQQDGRRSFQSLGSAVRLSPSAVAARVRRLQRVGVIKISAVELGGLARRQLSMGVGINLRGSRREELLGRIAVMDGVEFAATTVGRFDVVVTLVAPSTTVLYENLEQLRATGGVASLDCWQHLSVLKEDYTRTLRIPRPAGSGGLHSRQD